jgi:hypothetical protein
LNSCNLSSFNLNCCIWTVAFKQLQVKQLHLNSFIWTVIISTVAFKQLQVKQLQFEHLTPHD